MADVTVGSSLKDSVRAHWEAEPCGTRGISSASRREYFERIETERYELEPYILDFARFERGRGKRLLEIGVGAGTDFIRWVRAGAIATGIDLTDRGVELTRERLALEGLKADVRRADVERLPFENESFDIIYSYGVLHHTPDTQKAVAEVHRVLRSGGVALVMIYHVPSVVGFLLWGVYCAGKLRPWKSPRWAINNFLESPGTKAYTVSEARQLFSDFARVDIRTQLGTGDLLLMRPGEKYGSRVHRLAWRLYPKWLVRLAGDRFGLGMLIQAVK